jgi:hypothetical protein
MNEDERKVKSVSFDFTNASNKEKIGKIEITFNDDMCISTLSEGVEYLHRSGFDICNVNYVYEDELAEEEKAKQKIKEVIETYSWFEDLKAPNLSSEACLNLRLYDWLEKFQNEEMGEKPFKFVKLRNINMREDEFLILEIIKPFHFAISPDQKLKNGVDIRLCVSNLIKPDYEPSFSELAMTGWSEVRDE